MIRTGKSSGPYYLTSFPLFTPREKESFMVMKPPTKKMEFSEQDEIFIKQLAEDVGCYYSKANPRTYILNKTDSAVPGEMDVFAWVHKEESNYFWVSTRKIWIEAARAKDDADRKKTKPSCFPKDTQLANDSVSFDARGNYDQTVSSLKLVHQIR
jgi:hypothetical protein